MPTGVLGKTRRGIAGVLKGKQARGIFFFLDKADYLSVIFQPGTNRRVLPHVLKAWSPPAACPMA
jgi:hypothetical protein